MNILAFIHSYKLTHFSSETLEKTKNPDLLSTSERLSTLIFGVDNPRPENSTSPSVDYQTVVLSSNKEIECWKISVEHSKGTVALFHGYSGNKSSMLDKAKIFRELGYSTFLVDFMGSGGSEGRQTTIGYDESEQVITVFEHLESEDEKNIFLMGTSMGAVAILKALSDTESSPSGIILECPFGSMYETVGARFDNMEIPRFPMAGLLVFWGGVQNGFWAFGHNPTTYAENVDCPALLLYGEKDKKVSREEIDEIFTNLSGRKSLKLYPEAGHENYLNQYSEEWRSDIELFLNSKEN